MAPETSVPLGKYLASTDKITRDKSIKHLAAFLSLENASIPKSEMAKLWKGIFYCFWMSDKPLVQQALASELAELLLTISSTTGSLNFLRGFWETTVREWNGIDRLRIDKYYMLVRRFVNASFRLLIRVEWEHSACREYNDILTHLGGPLCADDIRIPHGLPYHLSDIYVEELDKAMANSGSARPAPLGTLLDPFIALCARTANTTTYKRVQAALFEPLLVALQSTTSEEPFSRKRPRLTTPAYTNLTSNACMLNLGAEGPLDRRALKQGLVRRIFEVASETTTKDANRRKMYAIWKSNGDAEASSDGFDDVP